MEAPPPVTTGDTLSWRWGLEPGDLGSIVRMHGTLYAAEQGFDVSFEAYVAGPLADFVLSRTDRDRLWIVERGGRLVACAAVVHASRNEAQLRWFLVDPAVRGRGVGTRLVREAIEFSRDCGYDSVFLWTVGSLEAAARVYETAGFLKEEERPGTRWGVRVV